MNLSNFYRNYQFEGSSWNFFLPLLWLFLDIFPWLGKELIDGSDQIFTKLIFAFHINIFLHFQALFSYLFERGTCLIIMGCYFFLYLLIWFRMSFPWLGSWSMNLKLPSVLVVYLIWNIILWIESGDKHEGCANYIWILK